MAKDLSPRECTLWSLMVDTPLPVKLIAHSMGITTGTAKIYASYMYRKMGVDGRVELMHQEIERLKAALTESDLRLLEIRLAQNTSEISSSGVMSASSSAG